MEERKVTFREVLGIPSFRLLWVGQLISNFGDRFSYMAVMGLILFRGGGSALESASLISMGVLGYLASMVPVRSLLFAMSACILMVVLVASLVPVSLERAALDDAVPAPATG